MEHKGFGSMIAMILMVVSTTEQPSFIQDSHAFGRHLFITRKGNDELVINNITVDGKQCDVKKNISKSTLSIDIGSCAKGKKNEKVEVTFYTERGLISRNIFIKGEVKNPFSPLSIGSLEFWIDSDESASITENGSNVSSIEDRSPNNYEAFASGVNRPSYQEEILGGRNVLEFDGDDESLTINSTPELSINETLTIFALVRFNSHSGAQSILRKDNSYVFQKSHDNLLCLAVWDGDNSLSDWKESCIDVSSIMENTWMLVTAQYNGTHYSIFKNGNLTDSHPTSAREINVNSVDMSIGSRPGNYYFDGQIGEILLYSKSLKDKKRRQIEGYIAHKWGIDGELPGNHTYKQTSP